MFGNQMSAGCCFDFGFQTFVAAAAGDDDERRRKFAHASPSRRKLGVSERRF